MKNQNQSLLSAEFNAALEAGEIERICAYPCAPINGFGVHLFRNVGTSGGWLAATDGPEEPGSMLHKFKISEDRVELAEAIKFDRENTSAYMRALLNLSNEIRGLNAN